MESTYGLPKGAAKVLDISSADASAAAAALQGESGCMAVGNVLRKHFAA